MDHAVTEQQQQQQRRSNEEKVDEDMDDGFIVPIKSNQKKMNKAKRNEKLGSAISSKYNNKNNCHFLETSSKVRFGGSQWTKPSLSREAPTVPIVATTTTAAATPFISPSQSAVTSSSPLPTPTPTTTTTVPSTQQQEQQQEQQRSPPSSWQFPFHKQSLSSLMEDYGEYDPNWMKMEETTTATAAATTTGNSFENETADVNVERTMEHETNVSIMTSRFDETEVDIDLVPRSADIQTVSGDRFGATETQQLSQSEPHEDQEEDVVTTVTGAGINRLQIHGHAPIHVEFVSFGYRNGTPSEIRYYSTGNCYNRPLIPFDIRSTVAPIPSYLSHIDGKAGIVKMTLLRWRLPSEGCNIQQQQQQYSSASKVKTHHSDTKSSSSNYRNVRDYVNDTVVPQVSNAIINAINIGQHGYVSPITISIYIGSEYGKHRSVVACECSAVALRKLLRSNDHHQYQCPISVGCRHRDIMNSSPQQGSSNNNNNNSNNKVAAVSAKKKKQKAFEDE